MLGLAAAGVPLVVALARAASAGQWRDDLPAVRDIGLVAVGFGGALSTIAAQALGIVPLGCRAFRASVGSVLAVGVAAWLLFRLAGRALAIHEAVSARPEGRVALSRTGAVIAAIATLTAAMSPTWQREASVGGGAMIATCCALASIEIAIACTQAARSPDVGAATKSYVALAALLAATFAESPPAALAAIVACATAATIAPLTRTGSRRARVPTRARFVAVVVAAVVAALLLAPLALRPLAPRAWVDVGRALSAASLAGFDAASARMTALGSWLREVGSASLAIAAGGGALGLVQRRTRPIVAALLAVVLLDVVFPARIAGVLSVDPLTAVRALAIAALATASALGVSAAVRWLLATGVPLARSGAVLLVVFHATLVALTSEEAGLVADRRRQLAAETWADSALGTLEPSAAVLVRSPAVAWRLWAARLTRGERPDVVVVPAPLLSRGRVAASLIATEPALTSLLRDFALTGEPSEFGLSKAADARKLYVELDPAWSKRLVSHLTVAGLWLEFAPQPLGASDRKLATSSSLVPVRRVLDALASSDVPDASTSSVISETLRNQADVLTVLGERETAKAYVQAVSALVAKDRFAIGVSAEATALRLGLTLPSLAAPAVSTSRRPTAAARPPPSLARR